MAFVNSPLPLREHTRPTRKCTISAPRMTLDSKPTRRAVLGLIATAGLGAMSATAVLAQTAEVKEELLGELKKLDYKNELLDVGPETEAQLKTRERKVANTPEYKQGLKDIREKEKKSFSSMIANEESEAAKLRATFGKK